MRLFKKSILWLLATPVLTLIFCLLSEITFINYINILFILSSIIAILSFIIIIIQEGVLDPTSYGFRRLTYQLSTKKRRQSVADDSFFNPKSAKKDHYVITSWIKYACACNIIYFLISIALAYII
ncbi:DUF3899 domain-containing protein [Staphylococcus arlettae]|uniref:DUF3899 domain-containing protein n=1 Tax=Staphylococcus arlettae TaxID=29378 RepID=UPI001E4F9C70|nr:DUF3899 domain-containing protein [Staphylococcus arlettae]MCD8888897.1 DUF3899 domain-containing protein [Staphylococcus arlettae]